MAETKAQICVLSEAQIVAHLELVRLWATGAYENMRDHPLLREATATIGCFACQAGKRDGKAFFYIIKKMDDDNSNEYGHTFYFVDDDYRALVSRAV